MQALQKVNEVIPNESDNPLDSAHTSPGAKYF